jgi:uncharacterized membrane protein YfcA
MPVSLESLALAAAMITLGYVVFGLSGFGSALITVPVLSHFWPMTFVLPVLATLDVVAALYLGVRHREHAARGELVRMVPFAFIGAVIGVTLLVNLPRDAALVGLGAFVTLYGAYALIERLPSTPVSRRWSYVSGITGGASGAVFGIGGPAYVIYLSRRLRDKSALRATLATLVIFSVGSRLLIFAVAGLVFWDELKVAFALLPFLFLGLWIGGHVHLRISPKQFARFISFVLIAMGTSLLVRAFVD